MAQKGKCLGTPTPVVEHVHWKTTKNYVGATKKYFLQKHIWGQFFCFPTTNTHHLTTKSISGVLEGYLPFFNFSSTLKFVGVYFGFPFSHGGTFSLEPGSLNLEKQVFSPSTKKHPTKRKKNGKSSEMPRLLGKKTPWKSMPTPRVALCNRKAGMLYLRLDATQKLPKHIAWVSATTFHDFGTYAYLDETYKFWHFLDPTQSLASTKRINSAFILLLPFF